MPKRISSRPSDISQAAVQTVQRPTEEPEPPKRKRKIPRAVSRVMSAMGKKGGRIGGKRSLVTLTPEERKERALKAAKARWAKREK